MFCARGHRAFWRRYGRLRRGRGAAGRPPGSPRVPGSWMEPRAWRSRALRLITASLPGRPGRGEGGGCGRASDARVCWRGDSQPATGNALIAEDYRFAGSPPCASRIPGIGHARSVLERGQCRVSCRTAVMPRSRGRGRACGASARPSGRSSPPSSKSTMPLHSRLQPCSGWPAMTWAATRAVWPADGHCGS